MSLLTRASDLVYTFRFLRLLTTPFENTTAYKLGIIDEKGKRIKSVKLDTSEKKSAYTPFNRIVYNIKKLLAKAPGGSTKLASYASALFLIKEHYGLSKKNIDNILEKSEMTRIDFLAEETEWFVLENRQLSPGIYRVAADKVLSETWDDVVIAKDKIRVLDNSFPVGDMFGLPIYEAVHMNTGRKVHITVGELLK
tara:strand:+ start:686 stop:1273 length:588 start_codon:yes stop_codon:yes gene_type:complete